MTTATFKTTGTHCPSCSMMIQLTVEELDGVARVSADHSSNTTTVEYDPALIDPDTIARAIEGAGYGAEFVG